MSFVTMSSREFDQNVASAKKAAEQGPVFITNRGRQTHVLLTFERYEVLTTPARSIVELLAMPGSDDIEFDPPRMGSVSSPVDLG